jgi:pyruvate dehydrogenase E1 component alpha subunit
MRHFRDRDPIKVMAERLKRDYADIEPAMQAIEAGTAEIIERAVQFAEESPEPGPEDLWRHVYA